MSATTVNHGAPSRYIDRPRLLAFGTVALASLAAWVALAALHQAVPYSGFDSGVGGPGIDWLAALCRGVALPVGVALPGAVTIWVLMSIAMMLPTAAPAIDIYVRLSLRLKLRRTAHVAGFAGGYLIAWAGLAVVAGGAQVALGAEIGTFSTTMPQNALAGGLLLLVGLYQLTPLKQACLTLCRNPMAFFMSHWRDGAGGALRMGVHHGVICIGCCWALMVLMFLSGAMNLAWMAALGLVMLLEKTVPGAAQAGRIAGMAMVLAGAALIVTDFV